MMKLVRNIFVLICFLFMLAPGSTHAELPYGTYYYDANLVDWRSIQAIYVPDKTLALSFEEPVDIVIADDDRAYVVDKGANHVVVLDSNGKLLQTLGDSEGPGKLNGPEGVFVQPDGNVYVADTGNERIALFGPNGKLLHEFIKPNTEYLEKEFHFVPTKLVVDKRGVMYVIVKGNDQGLLRLGPDGEFRGFYGSNKSEQSYVNWLKKLILNKEQLAKEIANRPRPVTNVTIDKNGFIFTASTGVGSGNIKKLNAGGIDAFNNRNLQNTWGILDLAIDQNQFIYDVDTDSGSISLFDPTGNPLFSFGNMGDSQQRGVLGFPTSLAVNSHNDIWVTDSKLKNIQTFKRTKFGNTILTATSLYYDGRYTESKPYWEQVYLQNDMYNLTFQGLGKVQLTEKDYTGAIENFKISYDVNGYSEAFWDIRLSWLQQHFLPLIIVVIIGLLTLRYLYRWGKRYASKRTWPPLLVQYSRDLKDLLYVLIHPYDGFNRLKDRKVSFVVLVFILMLSVAVKVMNIYWTGFIFNSVDTSKINVYTSVLTFLAIWVTWIIASYLVCSVKNGEARFREVVQASTYALSPYIFLSIPALILSNILVQDESVLYHSVVQLMMIWMLVMFFVLTQVLNNFEFVENIVNSLITIFTIIILWFFIFIISGLTFHLYDFFYQLYREVTHYG